MDLVLIELLLWIGLLLFFWALKDGLNRVESDIESLGLVRTGKSCSGRRSRFDRPEKVADQIGSYRDSPIFRFATIEGKTYQFDRICPPEIGMPLDDEERLIAPGLVYQECASGAQMAPASSRLG